jgi:uncharacterized protein YjiS (DUF1127 family)
MKTIITALGGLDALLVRAFAARKALLHRIAAWHTRAAERRELKTLTDRDLRDIGTTRSEVEANKPFCETYWQLMTVTDLEDDGTTRSKPFWMTYWL